MYKNFKCYLVGRNEMLTTDIKIIYHLPTSIFPSTIDFI